jgi:DNA-directed RNA polymerase III subunit RPC4
MQVVESRRELLYFFQFPAPFPSFASKDAAPPDSKGKRPQDEGRHVSFSEDTKEPEKDSAERPEELDDGKPPEHVDGVIGQLEVYQSGAVKMRLANGIVLDVRETPSVSSVPMYSDLHSNDTGFSRHAAILLAAGRTH